MATTLQEFSPVENPAEFLQESSDKLIKFGGFDLLEACVEGVQNMNPERKARKKIFLTEMNKKEDRETLKKTLEIWSKVLSGSDAIAEMVEECEKSAQAAHASLNKNLGKAIDSTRDLERSYRSTALFYKNSESEKIKNISIVNAELEQMKDLDNTRFIDAINAELTDNFDRLDLRENYSILVIPGYLGSNKVVEKWAKIAHENKVMLVTDFEHLDEPDDVMEMFEAANLTGGDKYRSNVMRSENRTIFLYRPPELWQVRYIKR